MFALFDIGGTKTRVAISRDGRSFEEPKIFDTPQNFESGIITLKNVVKDLSNGEKITIISGGIAGPLDEKKERMVGGPHLKNWIGKPLKERLQELLNAKVFIENDSSISALGEAMHGAGKGYGIVAYITVSTGVGGARIVDGRIDSASVGFEPGHQIIDADKTLCPDCDGNDLEAYISGTAIEKRYSKKPYEITDDTFWDEIAKFLAYGLNNVSVHWSPDVIVLGGSMMKIPGVKISNVEKHFKDILTIFPIIPVIKKAELKDVGGLYGALEIIRQNK
jgi:predicted NBD/HSP70 family sugar kinase